MAVYKVIQNVEAEDKLLGPLSLKGFIYASIAGILAFVDIRLAISGAPALLKTILIVMFLPPMVLFGVLASPLGREQPTEVWLLSRIKFLLKNKQRIWDQGGTKQLVTITAPKKAETIYTKNLSKDEVSSRLQALANTLDSRGWAAINPALDSQASTNVEQLTPNDERLAAAVTIQPENPAADIKADDDILDEQNNKVAQNLQVMIDEAAQQRKIELIEKMQAESATAARGAKSKRSETKAVAKDPNALTSDEERVLEKIHDEQNELRLHPPKIIKGSVRMTPGEQTGKLNLANYANDLSVASIARLVNKEGAS